MCEESFTHYTNELLSLKAHRITFNILCYNNYAKALYTAFSYDFILNLVCFRHLCINYPGFQVY